MKLTTLKFIERAREVHGDKYYYDKTTYINSKTKVVITCPCHGHFEQEANAHINKGYGCPTCGKLTAQTTKRNKYGTSWFITKATEKHAGKYGYDKVVYCKNTDLVTIHCPNHGYFEQEARVHLAGNGCMKCAKANNNYWSYSGWVSAAAKSGHFDSFKVYVIKCYNDTESFYKIGKTYNTLRLRFGRGQLPYKYKVVYEVVGDGLYICNLEQELLNVNADMRYTPEKVFAGSGECFKDITKIKDIINGSK